jgi:hypothetical protein
MLEGASRGGVVTAGSLRALGKDGLVSLLRRRPEGSAVPLPVSLGELAERLATPAVTVAALRRLDRPTLQVAEAVVALGGRAERRVLDRLLGAATAESRGAVGRALDRLRADALLVGDKVVELTGTAGAVWRRPLGLGDPVVSCLGYRTAADLKDMARNLGLKPAVRKAELHDQVIGFLRDVDRVRAVVAAAPAEVRDLLDKAATGGQIEPDAVRYRPYGAPRTSQVWAAARGLLMRASDWDGASWVMPAEVGLALRGPDYAAPFEPNPPAVPRSDADPATVARAAAAAGAAAVRLVADLLDLAGRTPVPTLRSGGIGQRELRRTAKTLGCPEPDLRLALSVAVHAGLLSFADGRVTPTTGYDAWQRKEPAARLAALLTSWWTAPSVAIAVTGPVNPGEPDAGVVALRTAMIGAASEPSGTAVDDHHALAELAIWRSPLAFGDPGATPTLAVACWQEATLLGVAAEGAVTAAGRALLDGADDLTTLVGDIGTVLHTAVFQADLTAVVGGTPGPELVGLLDLAADQESRGVASTWRFSPTSIRRALDSGQTATGLMEALAAASTGELPQPLRYLITDVARRHGGVRATAVTCCLRSDDVALLTEIAADRRLRSLGLRRLAPTVLAANVPLPNVLRALRAAGYAPVAEADDGAPIVERAAHHRAGAAAVASPRMRPRSATPRTDPSELARALLAAPDEALVPTTPELEAVRTSATNLVTSEARLLAYAIEHHQPVTIDYINRDGNASSRTIDDIELNGGSLWAWCRLREDQRWFNLKRIVGVQPASDA